jgi:hypothetical protein
MKTTFLPSLGLLLLLAVAVPPHAHAENHLPDIPEALQVPDGSKLSSRAYAVGVQIYVATPSTSDPTKLVWTFTGPEANLFDADGAYIGFHYAYAGPTRPAWESESGSLVVGARYVPPVVVNSSAIPWLRLDAVHASGPGIFKRVAYILRVNTTGGLAPDTPPTLVSQEVRVPYTAEYLFFRAPR